MYTEDGEILLSTAPEVLNSFAGLCHEAGAFCEAYKLDKKITVSVCLSRETDGSFIVLTPCGICQERLYQMGGDVEVAIPRNDNISDWESKKLSEVQPYYWAKPFFITTWTRVQVENGGPSQPRRELFFLTPNLLN